MCCSSFVVATLVVVLLAGCASTTITTVDAMAKLRIGMTMEEFWLLDPGNADWPIDMAASSEVSRYRMRDGDVWIRWAVQDSANTGEKCIRELSTDPMVE